VIFGSKRLVSIDMEAECSDQPILTAKLAIMNDLTKRRGNIVYVKKLPAQSERTESRKTRYILRKNCRFAAKDIIL
ncbi:MAG: hypothetical protein K2M57_02025, partial [Paramuribaculum sp.]|nr:hypothetical protein [Paramuribaculum sp.]